MLDLVIDPTQLNREYLTVRWPRNPCERAGWRSFRGKDQIALKDKAVE